MFFLKHIRRNFALLVVLLFAYIKFCGDLYNTTCPKAQVAALKLSHFTNVMGIGETDDFKNFF